MMPITIGVTTRNRPASLRACLQSIHRVLGDAHDVIVVDDAGDEPVSRQLASVPGLPGIRVLVQPHARGCIFGRNEIVREARHELVLLLDDDTVLLDADAVRRAIELMQRDPQVGAIGFAQAEADGRPWPEGMQAGKGQAPCRVAAFVGFAHLLRRSVFLALGGYQEHLVFYGEEKEYCLRLLAAGYGVVYLPDALVAHMADPGGRDARRYVRYAIRNDCLCAFYNDPWPVVAVGLPIRFLRYRRMAAGIPGGDPGGFIWLLRELWTSLPAALAGRRPLTWAQMRNRRQLRECPPYRPPAPQGSHA